jgi:hypothetical protein
MVWLLIAKLETLTVALTLSVAELKFPSEAVMAIPEPLAPGTSMKYSAVVMLEPPVVASLTEAVKVTDVTPAVGLGVTLTLVVKGPVVSVGGGAETVIVMS